MVTQVARGALGGTCYSCSHFQMTRLGQGEWQQLIHSPPVNSHSSGGGTCTGSTSAQPDVDCAVGRKRAIIVHSGAAEVRDSKGCCPPALPRALQGTPSSACGTSRDILHSCFGRLLPREGWLPADALFFSSF